MSFNSERFKKSTKIQINEFWDNKNSQFRISKDFPQGVALNKRLRNFQDESDAAFYHYLNEGDLITENQFHSWIDEKLFLKKSGGGLVEYFKKFIDFRKSNKADNTIKGYNSTINHIIEYEKSRKVSLKLESITPQFFRDFERYFFDTLGASSNTYAKYVKTLKAVLNQAIKDGELTKSVHKNYNYQERYFDGIFNTHEELEKMRLLELPETLARYRDAFLFMSYTSLRISDYQKLDPSKHIIKENGIEIIRVPITKNINNTGKFTNIPVNSIVSNILKAYHGYLPAVNETVMNREIKTIAEMAGIDEPITYIENDKGVNREVTQKKCLMMHNHVGRANAITNMFLAGFQRETIKKMTGISSDDTLNRYDKRNIKNHMEIAASNDFFK